MMHFFNVRRGRKADPNEEFDRLCTLLLQEAIPAGIRHNSLTVFDLFHAIFKDSKFRGTCVKVTDLYEEVLPGWRNKGFKVDTQKFILFAELTYNLLMELGDATRKADYGSVISDYNSCVYEKIDEVTRMINRSLEKFGYEITYLESEDCFVVVERNALLDVVADTKPNVQSLLVSYRRLMTGEHDVEARRSILNEIAREIEPMLSDKHLKLRCGKLVSDISCVLNNFHIRHNNTDDGKWKKPAIAKLKDSKISETLDSLFNMIIALMAEAQASAAIENVEEIMKLVCKHDKE